MMRIRNLCFVYQLLPFCILFVLFVLLAQSFAGSDPETRLKPSIKISADKQFGFAEYHYSNQEYLMAVGEYKRFIYLFPGDKRVEPAMYQIGMSYYLIRQFTAAINAFKTLIDRYVDTDFAIKSYFMISESHVKRNDFGPAIINLKNLITITHDNNVRDEAYYRMGWIFIETASWEKAKAYFSKISVRNKNKYRLERLNTELNKERLIPKKKPDLAGLLSIIPGAGYLYCERYQDALIAFLLNGGMIWASLESFDDDHNALGGVIAFVEFGFYAGNIYGSVASAHKYNRKKKGQFIEKLKDNTKINLSADFEKKGVCIAFQWVF